jgi:hypothetical protein
MVCRLLDKAQNSHQTKIEKLAEKKESASYKELKNAATIPCPEPMDSVWVIKEDDDGIACMYIC